MIEMINEESRRPNDDEIAARIADAGFDRDYALHVATIQRGELDPRFEV